MKASRGFESHPILQIRSHLSMAGNWIVDPVIGVRSPLSAPACPGRRSAALAFLKRGACVRLTLGTPVTESKSVARRHVLGTCRRWFESNLSDHFGRLSLWGDYLSYKEDRAGFDSLAAYHGALDQRQDRLLGMQKTAGSSPASSISYRPVTLPVRRPVLQIGEMSSTPIRATIFPRRWLSAAGLRNRCGAFDSFRGSQLILPRPLSRASVF